MFWIYCIINLFSIMNGFSYRSKLQQMGPKKPTCNFCGTKSKCDTKRQIEYPKLSRAQSIIAPKLIISPTFNSNTNKKKNYFLFNIFELYSG